ncbi:phosphatidylinositol 4-kinase [Leisingera sp. MMG026]|uniref:phosphatidylinositol 4-kinase n=1 Tax=Leisingera sp. MMG026 TaxID=2909982 RepID=UPI001F329EF1|nr:phosphatidylinositol 4-kinase [Leisingera sp. MMG026]MCF6433715.1 phosphatidylinositol 4-kinase [Leisingera sp. MMG026]
MPDIQLATVLLGAVGFNEGNVNDTYRGQVLTSDGATRLSIIKDLDITQLCNELLAYTLAREVKLPVPDCYIGLVRPGDLSLRHSPVLSDGSRLVFVSADVKVPNLTFRLQTANLPERLSLINQVMNWDDLGRLYAYDAWIANTDRHPGNILFGNKNECWMIDHGHSFTGPSWKPEHLNPDASYRHRLSEWLTSLLSVDQKKERAAEARKFGATIGACDIAAASSKSRIVELLPKEYLDALKDFLESRAAMVPQHSSRALGVPVMV